MQKNLFKQILNVFLQIITQKVINFLLCLNYSYLNFVRTIIFFLNINLSRYIA